MDEKLIGTGLVVLGGKDIIVKLLGPTAEYLGQETKNLVKKCNINITRIFNRAAKLLGNKLEQPGVVNPRILKHIINEGAFCEDELSAEYFGGVLASSRTEVSRDDRGLTIISTLSSLSTYQVRTHYILYYIVRKLFKGIDIELGIANKRRKEMKIFIPLNVYYKCMDFSNNENPNVIMPHILMGMRRLDLIEGDYAFGSKNEVAKVYPKVDSDGFFFMPTIFGIELYLWAHGHSNAEPEIILATDVEFKQSAVLDIPDGAVIAK
ncbi:MAG: hypothetical protein PHU59_02975 [Candidatus Omnitrophica bacterium]|nr:hypothetical protein [Candidatus Omnitrophota bacterium]